MQRLVALLAVLLFEVLPYLEELVRSRALHERGKWCGERESGPRRSPPSIQSRAKWRLGWASTCPMRHGRHGNCMGSYRMGCCSVACEAARKKC